MYKSTINLERLLKLNAGNETLIDAKVVLSLYGSYLSIIWVYPINYLQPHVGTMKAI